MKCWVTMYKSLCKQLWMQKPPGIVRACSHRIRKEPHFSPPKHVNSPVNLGSVATFYDGTQHAASVNEGCFVCSGDGRDILVGPGGEQTCTRTLMCAQTRL